MRPVLRLAEPEKFDAEAKDLLASLFEVNETPVTDDTLQDALAQCDVFWYRLKFRLDKELLSKARCKIIATPVTGIDQIDVDACKALGISIVCLKGETEFLREIRATAEHTLALTFALIRNISAAFESVKQGVWDRDRFPGIELYGKTVGIVGLGRLGTICAEYFRMLGMRVIGFDPRPSVPAWIERKDTLADLLQESDLVSLHVVANASTDKLIGKNELSAINPNAFLINTSRGSIVCEESLLSALKNKRLRGAALDVLQNEGDINATHPLLQYAQSHDNLLLTPHLGGNTPESFQKTERFLAEQVVKMYTHISGAAS